MRITMLVLALAMTASSPAHAGWFGPSTYEDCVLEHMKEASNANAAALIAMACRKKFPEPTKKDFYSDLDKDNPGIRPAGTRQPTR